MTLLSYAGAAEAVTCLEQAFARLVHGNWVDRWQMLHVSGGPNEPGQSKPRSRWNAQGLMCVLVFSESNPLVYL